MKKKKRLALVAGVLMTMSLSAGAAVLSGCGEQEDPNVQIETENLKTTYFVDKGANEYNVAFDGGNLTFSVAGDSRTGTFRYDGTNVTITFADNGEQLSAVIADGKLTFTYKDVNYEMGERKEYTVTFNMGGTTTTREVVIGRTVAKPSDPVKADNIFLGWYEDASFTKAFSFDTKITKNTTIYARFVSSISSQQEYTLNFDLGYDGAAAIAPVTTINGHAYQLPTPTRSGEKFLGWWVSDYNSRDKLSTQWDDSYVFGANTTLYAVWESDAPAVSVKSNVISWTAKGAGNSYTVDVYNSDGVVVHHVAGGVTSTNPRFDEKPAGEYRVEVKLGNQTTTVWYKNKALAPVSIFEVEGNVLKFNAVDGAQRYLVTAVCGESAHDHIEKEVPANAFDFSECKMVKGGIKFTVTAVADGKMSSVSQDYYVERNLDPANISVDENTGKVVWGAVEHATSYTLKINDGTTTKTVTNLTATEYPIKEYTGNLSFTVTPIAHGYNSPDETTFNYNKVSLPVPKNIRVTSDSIVWDPVDGATGYVVKINGVERTVSSGNSVGVSVNDFAVGQDFLSFSVRAIGAEAAKNSCFTDDLNIRRELSDDTVIFENGLVKWDAVIGATQYGVTVNDGAEVLVNATETSYEVTLTKTGVNEVKVRSIINGTPSAHVTVYANASMVTFDVKGGVDVGPNYVSEGGKIHLPETTRYGYDFAGWYTSAVGGLPYTDGAVKVGADNVTIYAHWTPQSFIVTVDPGQTGEFVGENPQTRFPVDFDGDFTLPVPESIDATRHFVGWATAGGVQYTDDEGKSIIGWDIISDTTLVPMWVDNIFSFQSITNGTEYQVTQGTNLISSKLTRVRVPATYNGKPVTVIGGDAFRNCTSLKTIEIPDTIKTITLGGSGVNSEGSAFFSCSNLLSVNVYHVEGNNEIRYYDEDGMLYRTNALSGKRELVLCPRGRQDVCVIPDGVEIIPVGAFKNCAELTSISIPSSVTLIEDEAFYGCSNLTNIEFRSAPNDADAPALTLGERVFAISSLGKLQEITLPKRLQVDNIDQISKIFASNYTVQKIHMESGSTLSSIDGVVCKGSKIIFCPRARKDEYTVPNGISEIGENAFYYCEKITKLTIPYSLQKIDDKAFYYCNSLTEIKFVISESELSTASLEIGTMAFYNCTKLKEVTLPMHLTKLKAHAFGANLTADLRKVIVECAKDEIDIEDGAFAAQTTTGGIGNTYVTDIEIGKNVREFAIAGAFGAKITNLSVDPNNQNFEAEDNVLFNKGKTTIVYYPTSKQGNYVIPDSVTKIGARVFENKNGLTSIEFGVNIREIGENAFKSCQSLTTVNFAKNRTTSLVIGVSAFESCTKLTTLSLPSRATTAEAGVAFIIDAKAFYNNNSLKNLVVPEGFTEIGHCAFGCCPLKEVSLPASITKLAEWSKTVYDSEGNLVSAGTLLQGTGTNVNNWYYDATFNGNIANIYTISIFDHERGRMNTSVGVYRVMETLSINSANTKYTTINNVLYKNNAQGEADILMFSAHRNEGVEGIITVPSTVTKISDDAFSYSEKLTEVKFAPVSADHTLEFGERIFGNCVKLNKISLPSGLTNIGQGLFKGNYELEEIFIPNTVTTIGNEAFANCKKLSTVTFEQNGTQPLTIVDGTYNYDYALSAFSGCDSLKSITLPERTTVIGKAAFAFLKNLQTVTLPGTLTKVGQYAFRRCTALTTVTFNDGEFKADGTAKADLTIDTYAFQETNLKFLTLPAHLKSIGNYAFDASMIQSRLQSVTIPAYTTTIGSNVFYNCQTLQTVTFETGSKLNSLGNYAFQRCFDLTSINLEECTSLVAIPTSAFTDCLSLASVTFSSNLQTINASAFLGCISLTSATFEVDATSEKSALKSIGDYAFQKTGLKSFTFPESTATEIVLGQKLFNYCYDLTKVTLSTSVRSVGSALAQCGSITQIIIPSTHASMQSRDQLILDIKKDSEGKPVVGEDGKTEATTITRAYTALTTTTGDDGKTGVFVIPEGITSIGVSAFAGQNNIKRVVLPKSLTSIGNDAFKACRWLEEVVIPSDSGLATIGENAFKNCIKLSSINLQNSKRLTTIGNYAFDGCIELSSINIPAVSGTLGTYLFRNCTALATVTLDNSITALSANMFEGCTSLNNVVLPAKVNKLGADAFLNCTSLKTLKYNVEVTTTENGQTVVSYNTVGADNEVILPNTLTDIGKELFRGCSSILKAKVPDMDLKTTGTSTIFGETMFQDCTSLQEAEYLMTTQYNGTSASTLKAYKIGGTIFYGCTDLVKVTLNNRVNYMGATLFRNCLNLTTVKCFDATLTDDPETTTVDERLIGEDNVVTMPKLVYSMGAYGFERCTSITKVDFRGLRAIETSDGLVGGNGVAKAQAISVGGYMFCGCTSLKTVILNKLTTRIGSSDTSLTMFTEYATYGDGPCTALTTLKYYDESTGTVVGEDDCITLPELTATSLTMFTGCTAIKAIDFSAISKCNNIGANVCKGLVNLETIILRDTIVTFNESAFEDCTKLKTIKYYDTTNGVVVGNDNEATFSPKVTTFGFNSFRNTGIEVLNLSNLATTTYFNNNVFNSCGELTTVIFNDKTTTLGGWMFGGCSELDTVKYVATIVGGDGSVTYETVGTNGVVTMPAGITNTGTNAFVNCAGITKVDLTHCAEFTAGTGAFYGCTNLDTVILGKYFAKFAGGMFEDCTSLSTVQWIDVDGSVHGETGVATFNPEFKGVAEGLTGPFSGCTAITSADLSAVTGKLEGEGLFLNCTALSAVTLGENITELPDSMFEGCSSLTTLDISNVTSFGKYLFKNSAIASVTLPEGLTVIPEGMFEGTTFTQITLPATLTTIGEGAFRDSAITSITLPATLTTIGEGAFAGTAITAIALHEGITTIGEGAFENTGLTEVTLPESLATLGSYAFSGTNLTTLTIPASVTALGTNICTGCTGFQGITLAAGSAFDYDDNGVLFGEDDDVTVIYYVPADMECDKYVLTTEHKVMAGAFNGCDGVQAIEVPVEALLNGNVNGASLAGYKGTIEVTGLTGTITADMGQSFAYALGDYVCETLVISEGVTEIANSAFENFTGAKEVVLPSTITTIGQKAFATSSITKINIPEGVTKIGGQSGIYSAFNSAVNLEEVVFNATDLDIITKPAATSTMTSYNSQIFFNCSGLKKITFGENVKYIPYGMFQGCASLEEVHMGAGVVSIGIGAFSGCSALTEIELPEGITALEENTFTGTGLTSIVIPKNVTRLGSGVFYNCAELSSVQFAGNKVTEIGASTGANGVFENCSKLTEIAIGENVTVIGVKAFKGTGITSFTVPQGVDTINTSVFEDCANLTTVSLPEGLIYIYVSAFKNSGITSIKIPSSTYIINASAFEGCRSLTKVDMSECTMNLSNNAIFKDCVLLSQVILSDKIGELSGANLFENCTSLTNFVIPTTVYKVGNIFTGWTAGQTITVQYNALDDAFDWTVDWIKTLTPQLVYQLVETEANN